METKTVDAQWKEMTGLPVEKTMGDYQFENHGQQILIEAMKIRLNNAHRLADAVNGMIQNPNSFKARERALWELAQWKANQ